MAFFARNNNPVTDFYPHVMGRPEGEYKPAEFLRPSMLPSMPAANAMLA